MSEYNDDIHHPSIYLTENRVLKYRLQLVYEYIMDISQSGDLDGLRDWLKEIDEDEAKALEAKYIHLKKEE
tara:strand:- start:693 stop:905 length:213 start_codon:yes stop_codon:yes gene_type:complete